jgi:hypothetical protein
MYVVHIEQGKSHQSKLIGLVCTVLVELFTAHLLQKKSRFYHFLRPRYMRNKNVCKHFWLFFDIRKNVSFHIVTKTDSLSRVFINFVVYRKNFILSSCKQKKIQPVWLRNG